MFGRAIDALLRVGIESVTRRCNLLLHVESRSERVFFFEVAGDGYPSIEAYQTSSSGSTALVQDGEGSTLVSVRTTRALADGAEPRSSVREATPVKRPLDGRRVTLCLLIFVLNVAPFLPVWPETSSGEGLFIAPFLFLNAPFWLAVGGLWLSGTRRSRLWRALLAESPGLVQAVFYLGGGGWWAAAAALALRGVDGLLLYGLGDRVHGQQQPSKQLDGENLVHPGGLSVPGRAGVAKVACDETAARSRRTANVIRAHTCESSRPPVCGQHGDHQ